MCPGPVIKRDVWGPVSAAVCSMCVQIRVAVWSQFTAFIVSVGFENSLRSDNEVIARGPAAHAKKSEPKEFISSP